MTASPPLRPATFYAAIIGQVLAWLREDHGWTQGEMAVRMGVSHPVWSRVERGDAPLRMEALAVAARELGKTPAEVIEYADRVRHDADARGVEVLDSRPDGWIVAGAVLIGAAALGALIGSLLNKRK